MAKLFANSGDPDQMPHSAASDLGLHCLPITLLWVSRLQWVKPVLFASVKNQKKWTEQIQMDVSSHPIWIYSVCKDMFSSARLKRLIFTRLTEPGISCFILHCPSSDLLQFIIILTQTIFQGYVSFFLSRLLFIKTSFFDDTVLTMDVSDIPTLDIVMYLQYCNVNSFTSKGLIYHNSLGQSISNSRVSC